MEGDEEGQSRTEGESELGRKLPRWRVRATNAEERHSEWASSIM